MRLAIIILLNIILFVNAPLLDFRYPGTDHEVVNLFWKWRLRNYAVMFWLMFWALRLESNINLIKYEKFFCFFGIGLAFGDIISRYNGVTWFEWKVDLPSIAASLLFGYRKYLVSHVRNKSS